MNIISVFYDKTKDFKSNSVVYQIYLNFLYTLVILFPVLLLTGPFLPDLVIVLCSISFIYLNNKSKISSYYFKNNLIKLFVFFWICIVISSLTADNIFFSLKSYFFYIRFIIF